ncbi:hypothetical protein [Subtercola endophyticus]|uniref:hypothetical protein n=1 Tax=Subtercola endophyticus TaxID=2895559 RepID=UPI001E2E1A8B|nr:hypothetical protein [Subtercola endophyticus]UFS57641.1 hypothetical protein LQ955_11275 [Subtercola endophyticus]
MDEYTNIARDTREKGPGALDKSRILASDWMLERYQVKISGIANYPNDWATEHDEPEYILNLVKRIVTVSVETVAIVDALPTLRIRN